MSCMKIRSYHTKRCRVQMNQLNLIIQYLNLFQDSFEKGKDVEWNSSDFLFLPTTYPNQNSNLKEAVLFPRKSSYFASERGVIC